MKKHPILFLLLCCLLACESEKQAITPSIDGNFFTVTYDNKYNFPVFTFNKIPSPFIHIAVLKTAPKQLENQLIANEDDIAWQWNRNPNSPNAITFEHGTVENQAESSLDCWKQQFYYWMIWTRDNTGQYITYTENNSFELNQENSANLVFKSMEIITTTDGNKIINAGENVTIEIEIENIGTAEAPEAIGYLSSVSEEHTTLVSGETLNFGTPLQAGGTAKQSFEFSVSANVDYDQELAFKLDLASKTCIQLEVPTTSTTITTRVNGKNFCLSKVILTDISSFFDPRESNGPDIFYRIFDEAGNLLEESATAKNHDLSTLGSLFYEFAPCASFNNLTETYSIKFYDDDSGALSESPFPDFTPDLIGIITFKMEDHLGDFPTSIPFADGTGLMGELEVSWD